MKNQPNTIPVLRVDDDGVGSGEGGDAVQVGVALRLLPERVEALGARLHVQVGRQGAPLLMQGTSAMNITFLGINDELVMKKTWVTKSMNTYSP